MFHTSRWCNWQISTSISRVEGRGCSKKSLKARKGAHLSIRPVCTHKKSQGAKKSWRAQKSSISIRSPFPPQTTHNKAKAKKKHPTQLAAQKKRKKDLSLSLSLSFLPRKASRSRVKRGGIRQKKNVTLGSLWNSQTSLIPPAPL